MLWLTDFLTAAESGSISTLKFCLQSGAKLAARDHRGRSALHLAASVGNHANVQWLLGKGADLSTRDVNGSIALHLASINGNVPTIELLATNLYVNSRGAHGNTPLHLASANGNVGGVRKLIKHGAKVNAVNDQMSTPMHLAAANDRCRVVDTLCTLGAEIDAKDKNGYTAREVADFNSALQVRNFFDQYSGFAFNLPPGWQIRYTAQGRAYYVNHNEKSTQWTHPTFELFDSQVTPSRRTAIRKPTISRTPRDDKTIIQLKGRHMLTYFAVSSLIRFDQSLPVMACIREIDSVSC
jgi:hypothetical protein